MCSVSMIGDDWRDNGWPKHFPGVTPPVQVTRAEFDSLKRRVDFMEEGLRNELRAELEKVRVALLEAREEDIRNNEPDCEMDDKVAMFKLLGKILDVTLDEVFKKKNAR